MARQKRTGTPAGDGKKRRGAGQTGETSESDVKRRGRLGTTPRTAVPASRKRTPGKPVAKQKGKPAAKARSTPPEKAGTQTRARRPAKPAATAKPETRGKVKVQARSKVEAPAKAPVPPRVEVPRRARERKPVLAPRGEDASSSPSPRVVISEAPPAPAAASEESGLETHAWQPPASYQVTRLRLKARDPEWLFAYWDVAPDAQASLEREMGGRAVALSPLTLRLLAADATPATVVFPETTAGSIYLPTRGRTSPFRAELGFTLPSGEFRLLVASDPVDVPRGESVPDASAGGDELEGGLLAQAWSVLRHRIAFDPLRPPPLDLLLHAASEWDQSQHLIGGSGGGSSSTADSATTEARKGGSSELLRRPPQQR